MSTTPARQTMPPNWQLTTPSSDGSQWRRGGHQLADQRATELNTMPCRRRRPRMLPWHDATAGEDVDQRVAWRARMNTGTAAPAATDQPVREPRVNRIRPSDSRSYP